MYLCVVTLLLIVLYTVNPMPVQTYTTAMSGPSRRTITGEVSCQINTLTPMFTDAVCQGTLVHIYNIQQRSNRTFYTFLKKLLVTLIHTTFDIFQVTDRSYVNGFSSDLFDSSLPASTEYTCSCRIHLCLYMFLHSDMDFFHIHLCLKRQS